MVLIQHPVKVRIHFLHGQQVLVVLISLSLHALVSALKLSVLSEELTVRIHHLYGDGRVLAWDVCLLPRIDSTEDLTMVDVILRCTFHLEAMGLSGAGLFTGRGLREIAEKFFLVIFL